MLHFYKPLSVPILNSFFFVFYFLNYQHNNTIKSSLGCLDCLSITEEMASPQSHVYSFWLVLPWCFQLGWYTGFNATQTWKSNYCLVVMLNLFDVVVQSENCNISSREMYFLLFLIVCFWYSDESLLWSCMIMHCHDDVTDAALWYAKK